MLGLSRKWAIAVAVVAIVKAILAVLTPLNSDFVTFIGMASGEYYSLSRGTVLFLNVYTGLGVLLAPFFGLWAALPIRHDFGAMIGIFYFDRSIEAFLLVFAIKLPILLFDLLAGVFVFFLVRDITGSSQNGGKAFLFWFLNPFNVFMLEMWGSMDVIPAAFVLLAALFALRKRWVASGVTLSLATLLRVFPLLLVPVFLLYCIRGRRVRATVAFMASFLAPMGAAFYILVRTLGSVQAVANVFMSLAFSNAWLLRFYGIRILQGVPNVLDKAGLPLALFLYPIQLYVASRFWKTQVGSLVSLTTAFLLIHFASTSYEPYHFNWIVPLLAVYYGIDRRRFRLLAVLFIAAFIAMYTYSDVSLLGNAIFLFPAYIPAMQNAALAQFHFRALTHDYVPLSMGVFHGLLAVFVIKLNLEELKPLPLDFLVGRSGSKSTVMAGPVLRSALHHLTMKPRNQSFSLRRSG